MIRIKSKKDILIKEITIASLLKIILRIQYMRVSIATKLNELKIMLVKYLNQICLIGWFQDYSQVNCN